MLGLMQNRPLLISSLIDYAAAWHDTGEIVSRDPKGVFHRTNWANVAARAKRLAGALETLGVGPGERVATLAWNSYRHLELYYGVSGSGRVLHTVNPRLFKEQLLVHHQSRRKPLHLLRPNSDVAGGATGATPACGERLGRAIRSCRHARGGFAEPAVLRGPPRGGAPQL